MKRPFAFTLMWLVILKTIDALGYEPALILDKNDVSKANEFSTFEESKKIMNDGKSWCSDKHSVMCAWTEKDDTTRKFHINCHESESDLATIEGDYCIKKEASTQFMKDDTFSVLESVPASLDAKPTNSCFMQQYTDQKDKITTKYFRLLFGEYENFVQTETNYNGFTFYKLYCSTNDEKSRKEARESEKEFLLKKETKTEVKQTKTELKEIKTEVKENDDNKENSKENKDEDKSSNLIVVIFILITIILLLIIVYLAGRYYCQDIQDSDDIDYDEEEANLSNESETN